MTDGPADRPAGRSDLVRASAECVIDSFEDYNASFSDITRRARRRFEHGDRAGMRADVVARIQLYDQIAEEAISRLELILANRLFSHSLWQDIRSSYGARIADCVDCELYKTFFNTITRRLFRTRGVDPAIEFVALEIEPDGRSEGPLGVHVHSLTAGLLPEVFEVLARCRFSRGWSDQDRDARRIVARLEKVAEVRGTGPLEAIEVLDTVFYREGRAYLVGRVRGTDGSFPCVIALIRTEQGIAVEAMLTRRRELSILFGFTYSYFLADLPAVSPSVSWLQKLLPDKPLDELYTVLGRAKQGKTERYRSFFRYMQEHPSERLIESEGERGMVMLVFTLPGYPLVFKLIRDRFSPAKKFGRHRVIERYRLVYRHDRIGRLLDVQEFKRLRIDRERFDLTLLDRLESDCSRSARIGRDSVVIDHCFLERRLRPLDLYLDEVDAAAAREAVIDYGQALKDLACSNIFAGDLLPKNFGVTRSGRVIFYDYDELRLMTECRFRNLPEADDDLLELHDEPWFNVDDNDVFPEQFPRFMALKPEHLALLRKAHGELFDAAWWQRVRARIASGEALDVPPYGPEARL